MIVTIQGVNFSYLIVLMTCAIPSLEEILECDLIVVKNIKI